MTNSLPGCSFLIDIDRGDKLHKWRHEGVGLAREKTRAAVISSHVAWAMRAVCAVALAQLDNRYDRGHRILSPLAPEEHDLAETE